MGRLGGLTWKEFYRRERDERYNDILNLMRDSLDSSDPEVDEIIEKGGVLSFPHTYIDTSIEPVVRTVSAIHRAKRSKVIALGVMHSISENDPEKEFSLDSFKWTEREMREDLGTGKLDIEYVYLPRRSYGDRLLLDAESEMEGFAEALRPDIDAETCIVMTGDLTHYGEGYGTVDPVKEPGDMILSWCREDLETLYEKGDVARYLEAVKHRKNDQWASALVTKKLLGDDLKVKIFRSKIADYSDILGSPSPTCVAAIFYGVYPLCR